MIRWRRRSIAAVLVLGLAGPSLASQASSASALAETLVRAGQFDQAIALLEQTFQTERPTAQTLNLLGIARSSKGEVEAGNREYLKALALDPAFLPALKNLAINEIAQRNLPSATRHLTAALKLAPADTAVRGYLGRIAYAQHEHATAAAHFAKADVGRDPELASQAIDSYLRVGQQASATTLISGLSPAAFSTRQQFRIGLALAARGRFDEAIPYFEAVGRDHPESYDAAFNLALCLVEAKRYPQAIAVLGAAAERGHTTAELNNLLAQAYEADDRTQEAIDALREAIRLSPDREDSYVDLAALCSKYEAFPLALDIIDVGLRQHPRSDRLLFQRGVVYAMTNRFDLAEQDFQAAAMLAPQENFSYVALGITQMQAGELGDAIAQLRARIRTSPNDATLQYLLGDALTRAGAVPGDSRFDEARRALEASVRLNAKFAPARVDLAKLLLKEDRTAAAIRHLEAARTLDPKSPSTYSQLAVAYRRTGDLAKSSAMIATLNELNAEERAQAGRRKRLQAVDASRAP
jgi:tetratricopeptide (TPR) repeat protein